MQKRHALITGGATGIGLAIAKQLRDNGADVTIASRNKKRMAASGFPYVEMDVTQADTIHAALENIAPVDIFVANAGGVETAPALKTDRELWERMISLNLTSVFSCAGAVLPGMVKRGWGRFIAIGSTASLKGYAYCGAYSAAKHGVIGWIRTIAIELAQSGVTANAVCPGYTLTPLVENAAKAISEKTGKPAADAISAFAKNNPMGRILDPDEVASAVAWLCTETARSVTGQSIVIDGGETVS